MADITLRSSPSLDAMTQNNWAWASQAEAIANVGAELDVITSTFPKGVLEYGAFGLACNTIHDYLYKKLNELDAFVSIIVSPPRDTLSCRRLNRYRDPQLTHTFDNSLQHAVSDALHRTAAPGSEIFILGSAVTMGEKGEYGSLWQDGWKINNGIEASERGWLWDNVILKVQQGNDELAHENLKSFLAKHVRNSTTPVALSCTELPIAAKKADGNFIDGYNFIDPNLELAKAVIARGEERLKKFQPESYAGWMMGVKNFEEKCCDRTNADEGGRQCTKCCEGKAC